MLGGTHSWLYATAAGSVKGKRSHGRPRNSEVPEMSAQPVEHKVRLDASNDEHAAGGEAECDWDEYADELASAVAFASWQQASEAQLDWDGDGAKGAVERGELLGFGENWEDSAADDELENDVTYHWG